MPNDSAWQYFKPFHGRFHNIFCRRRTDLTGTGDRFEIMECPSPRIEKTALRKKDSADAAFSVIRSGFGALVDNRCVPRAVFAGTSLRWGGVYPARRLIVHTGAISRPTGRSARPHSVNAHDFAAHSRRRIASRNDATAPRKPPACVGRLPPADARPLDPTIPPRRARSHDSSLFHQLIRCAVAPWRETGLR